MRRSVGWLSAGLVVAGALTAACSSVSVDGTEEYGQVPIDARHVGRETCAECHERQAELWRGSHHDLAMQPADGTTVLGDFDHATFTHYGVTSTFFRRDGGHFVRTEGPDGELHDYRIAYTFGVEPLQQYLVAFPGGRLQALSICWDARPAGEGGRRWFHLYPDERIEPGDPLHWTGHAQNWNHMCAECHSTNLRKNYDLEADRYDTTWSEIDVSCEACHGPGSRHVEWARRVAEGSGAAGDPGKGLLVRLGAGGEWVFGEGADTATSDDPGHTYAQVETCARCHARRTPVAGEYVHGRPIADSHRVALLDETLYHADGQILEEVYVYGSFLQSRMRAAGVACSDCHEPHSARLVAEGNGLCNRCHRPEVFDTPDHHHHPRGSAGARCIECHMISRDYMVVDPRRDHSFRIPRPDLSVALGTPDACTDCHDDRAAAWAAAAVVRWHGNDRPRAPHYAEALHAGRRVLPEAEERLRRTIMNPQTPGIARATALTLLGDGTAPAAARTVRSSLDDRDPLVRAAAAGALGILDPASRAPLAVRLLEDPVRTVRLEAARALLAVPPPLLGAGGEAAVDRAAGEIRRAQSVGADRPDAHLNLGWLHTRLGAVDRAEEEYRTAIRLGPWFGPAYVNLADLHRQRGRDEDGERVLREGLAVASDNGDLHHALGLLLVRRGRPDEAIASLRRAAELSPGVPRYGAVLGIALNSAGRPDEAMAVLEEAHRRFPGDRELLFAAATISRDAGAVDRAVAYAKKLAALTPHDPAPRRLLAQLEASR